MKQAKGQFIKSAFLKQTFVIELQIFVDTHSEFQNCAQNPDSVVNCIIIL